jgi:WD40 repeat protein
MNEQVANSENTLEAQAANAEITPILDLKIGKDTGGHRYPVTILNTPSGLVNTSMHFPFTTTDLKDYLSDLRFALLFTSKRSPNILSQREMSVRKFGEQLFDALIADEALKQKLVEQQGMLLHIRLRIEDPELCALPWELLYDSRTASYVCSSQNVSIIRYTEVAQPISPIQVQSPLYILGMIADPDGLDPIDKERQKGLLEEALKGLKHRDLIELHWLEGTWKALEQRLLDKKDTPCHIFHLIGHGRYDSQSGQGKVAFMTENGETKEIETQQLANLLINHSSLRVVILDAGEGPSGHELDVFSNTATTLVSTGIPAVLTTQYKHTDHVSIEFYRTFYESLAQGITLDKTLAKARLAINSAASPLAFGTYSLHTSSTAGVLFEIPRRKSRKYLKPDWRLIFLILTLLILISALLLFILSFAFHWLSSWATSLIVLCSIIAALYAVLQYFGFVPTPFSPAHFHFSKRSFFNMLKYAWPPYRSSRRWFLRGALAGIGLLAVVEAVLYTVSTNLPEAVPIPTPTPEGPPKMGDIVGEYDGSTGVNAVAWSPKTNYIAIAGSDGIVHLWDWQITASLGAISIEKTPFVGHASGGLTENVNAIVWFPDGTKLASGGDDKTVQIWDFATSARIYTYNGHNGSVNSVACSPDGKYIASGSADHTVQVFDASTGKHRYTYNGHLDAVTAVAWSPDSKRIASGSVDKTVQVWDALTGNHIVKQTQHQEGVSAVAWSPDRNDSRIASASYDGATAVLIWDASSGKVIYPHILEGGATSVAWSSTGQKIACGGSGTGVQVWDSATNNLNLFTFTLSGYGIKSVTWSYDDLYIASSSASSYSVQVWQAAK